jgi:hyperosmotically inducible protein
MNIKRTILSSFVALSIGVNAGHALSTTSLTDDEITNKINSLYHKSPLVNSHDIKVKTEDHTVSLSGQVDSDRQFERAVSLAGSVNGVDDILTDNLTVKASKSPIADTLITAKVKGVYLKSKLFKSTIPSRWPVKIETKNNVVFLTGTVTKPSTRKKLVNIAQHVSGVKEVKSSITIKK